jgi:hypothetical protein
MQSALRQEYTPAARLLRQRPVASSETAVHDFAVVITNLWVHAPAAVVTNGSFTDPSAKQRYALHCAYEESLTRGIALDTGGSVLAPTSSMRLLTARRWLPVLFGLIFALYHASPSQASQIKDQAFEPSPPDTIPTIFSNLRWAQTFTVGITGTLTGVDVLVAQLFQLQPEDLEITIFSTIGGVPYVAVTAPFHLSPATVPIVSHPSTWDGYAYLRAPFALPVTAGDVLAIVVSTGPTSQYYWAGAFAGGYRGGQLYENSAGSWFPSGSEDQAFRTFVAPSRAPTANAGNNQTVRPGTTVNLDGSGSYDDNTQTNLLQYAWAFVSVPTGSIATTLIGANTMTPSFVPDLPGNYAVQLVVTDEDGLSSQPSQVTIGENLPPTANAGPDQLVIVNHSVALNGSAIDPDGDAIVYCWQFTGEPAGSNAQFTHPNAAAATFIPDLPGVYVTTLTPSDFLGPGTSARATITVATATMYAEIESQAVAAQVQSLAADAVTTGGNQNALIQLLSNVVVALQSGNLTGARQQLQQAISRTDGCELQGAPDGNGPGRDWITTCAAQEQVYPPLVAILAALTP